MEGKYLIARLRSYKIVFGTKLVLLTWQVCVCVSRASVVAAVLTLIDVTELMTPPLVRALDPRHIEGELPTACDFLH